MRSLGGPAENEQRQMPQAFLMEVMEWNETLEAARESAPGSAARSGLPALEASLREQRESVLAELHRLLVPLPARGAPALAQAAVGIAMGGAVGGAASDVAMETADVVLLSDDLGKLPAALSLGRRTRTVVRQNLTLALGVICVVAPLAALGYTKLSVAVLLHEGSTIVVVLNALRLLRKDRDD